MAQRWVKGALLAQACGRGWQASHLAVPTVRHRSDGGLDVYASSRDRAGRSHVCRLTLSSDWPDESAAIELELVLGPGDPGTFDDSGAMASWLRETPDSLELYYIG